MVLFLYRSTKRRKNIILTRVYGGVIMRILDDQKTLRDALLGFSNKRISIVTAFAVSTENLIDELLNRGNNVELLVGTINAFTSPAFLRYFSDKKGINCNLFVDFRYEKSIHWKLYLIEPDIVIIGSSNLTNTGISLARDTCVQLENQELYDSYVNKIVSLKNDKKVLHSSESTFDNELKEYEKTHRRVQRGLVNTSSAGGSLKKWLSLETNQLIPLFIWDRNHSKEEREQANIDVSEFSVIDEEVTGAVGPVKLRMFFTTPSDELCFEEGETVLCMSSAGSGINFYTFDRITHHNETAFMLSFKDPSKSYKRPFKISNVLRENLKSRAPMLYHGGCDSLDRNTLLKLI